jgi:dTDP-4-dehydrorhamnose 3,5-epimerase
MMKIVPLEIPGLLRVEPDMFRDERGFFFEAYHRDKYKECGIREDFVQDSHSFSRFGTLRGLHAQAPHAQAKIIRVAEGEIFDVAVDARPRSPTFGKWISEIITGENGFQFYIPPGFLHGFLVLSERAQVVYKSSDFYFPGGELGVRWDDADLSIRWPQRPLFLSEKDRKAPPFESLRERFNQFG